MWSKYGECLLPIHGEIRPQSCLPGNASAILGCPNLEIPTSDDQRWAGKQHWEYFHCTFQMVVSHLKLSVTMATGASDQGRGAELPLYVIFVFLVWLFFSNATLNFFRCYFKVSTICDEYIRYWTNVVCFTSLMASLIRSVGGLSKCFYQGLWLADLNADVIGQSMNRRGVAQEFPYHVTGSSSFSARFLYGFPYRFQRAWPGGGTRVHHGRVGSAGLCDLKILHMWRRLKKGVKILQWPPNARKGGQYSTSVWKVWKKGVKNLQL